MPAGWLCQPLPPGNARRRRSIGAPRQEREDDGVIDYHVHLWKHAPHLPWLTSVDQLGGYCALCRE
jgi:hypothetical protein